MVGKPIASGGTVNAFNALQEVFESCGRTGSAPSLLADPVVITTQIHSSTPAALHPTFMSAQMHCSDSILRSLQLWMLTNRLSLQDKTALVHDFIIELEPGEYRNIPILRVAEFYFSRREAAITVLYR